MTTAKATFDKKPDSQPKQQSISSAENYTEAKNYVVQLLKPEDHKIIDEILSQIGVKNFPTFIAAASRKLKIQNPLHHSIYFTDEYKDVGECLNQLYDQEKNALVKNIVAKIDRKYSATFSDVFFLEFLKIFLGTWIGYSFQQSKEAVRKKGISIEQLYDHEMKDLPISIKSLNSFLEPDFKIFLSPTVKKQIAGINEKFVNAFSNVKDVFRFAFGLAFTLTLLNPYLKNPILPIMIKEKRIDKNAEFFNTLKNPGIHHLHVVQLIINNILNDKLKSWVNNYDPIIDLISNTYNVLPTYSTTTRACITKSWSIISPTIMLDKKKDVDETRVPVVSSSDSEEEDPLPSHSTATMFQLIGYPAAEDGDDDLPQEFTQSVSIATISSPSTAVVSASSDTQIISSSTAATASEVSTSTFRKTN